MPDEPRLDPAALRTARLAAGLTQHELARLIGVAGGERVSRWELGTSVPRPQTLRKIAACLHVEISDLLGSPSPVASLHALRVRSGLSLTELAERVHLSKATLSRWESGRVARRPEGAVLVLLAQSLGVTVEDVEAAVERSTP
jgi:transcriptional regulator with XRE-family HTH domain